MPRYTYIIFSNDMLVHNGYYVYSIFACFKDGFLRLKFGVTILVKMAVVILKMEIVKVPPLLLLLMKVAL